MKDLFGNSVPAVKEPVEKAPKKGGGKKRQHTAPDITTLIDKPTRFIGLDLSLRCSGICIISDVRTGRYETDVVKTNRRTGPERLAEIKNAIARRIGLEDESGSTVGNCAKLFSHFFVAIEGYSFASINQLPYMGELGGAVKVMLYEYRIPFITVTPSTLKKYATGKGNYPKADLPMFCREKWGTNLNVSRGDELDAYILARCAASLFYPQFMKYAYEQEVVHKLKTTWHGWTPF